MSRATRETAATRSLRTRIDTKATGRLVLQGDLAVHLLHGDVLAATCPDDDRQIVRMLHLRSLVDDARAEDLEAIAEGGGDVFGEILGLGLGVAVDPILRERFLQNLCDFVVAPGTPKFVEQKGVFVANIQMGHSTDDVIEEACRLADLAKAIDLTALVMRGTGSPGKDPIRQTIAEALSTEPRSVEELLAELPVEPMRGRVVLAELLLDGVAAQHAEDAGDEDDTLMTAGARRSAPPAAPRSVAPPPRSTAPPATPRAAGPSAGPSAAAPTTAPTTAPPAAPRAAAPSAPTGTAPPGTPRSTAPPATPRGAAPPAAAPPAAATPAVATPAVATPAVATPAVATPEASQDLLRPAAQKAPVVVAPVEDLDELEPEPLSDDGDVELPDPDPSVDGSPPESGGKGAPRSLSDYLAKTAAVGDDDLDFFSDHDYERGGEADGLFKTDTRNLDKIDVGAPPPAPVSRPVPKEDETIEVDEAPSSRFGAPPLSEEEAFAKIEVANEVLQSIVDAFDEAEGSGRGRAVVQLLVDGVPSQFATLLHDLKIDDDGELPARVLVRNLADRPPTEHRQLLNNSLADIIERALSTAADELPDDKLDGVLESVAGYRSRLGL